jgi:hypothetical protein
VVQHRRRVGGAFGVEGEPRIVVALTGAQRLQDPRVGLVPAVRGDRLFDGEAGDLVPESQPPAVAGDDLTPAVRLGSRPGCR